VQQTSGLLEQQTSLLIAVKFLSRVARYFPLLMAKIFKKSQNWLVLKKCMAKNTQCFKCGNWYNHRGLEMFGKQDIFCRKNLVLPKKQGLTRK